MEKLFEKALRGSYRFNYKGLISVEDLWTLGTAQLDSIYKELNKQLKEVKEESLLDKKTSADEILQNKIDIIKYIVGVKIKEKEERAAELENSEKRQRIMEIIKNKKDKQYDDMPVEELEKLLKELGK